MRYFDAYRMEKWLFTRCGECGAVVAEVDQETHTEWHERRADRYPPPSWPMENQPQRANQGYLNSILDVTEFGVGSKEEADYVAALKAECDAYLGSRQRLPWGPDHPDYDEMGQ
jgi:hypothetical protein